MKPARFTYRRARSIGDALALLAAPDSDTRVLAGGQSLVPLLNMRLARPTALVDITRIVDLRTIEPRNGRGLRLGAAVRHSDLVDSALVADRAPLLVAAARHVGHRAIRNMGTLGGSLAHADPAAELPAAAIALDARIAIHGQGHAPRVLPAEDLFVAPFRTVLDPTELLVDVQVPDQSAATWGFAEVARRPGDFAIAGVAATVHLAGGICRTARVVGFGVGDAPIRLVAAEALLAGQAIEADVARRAGQAAAAALLAPPTDVHASGDYRRHLVGVLTEQVLLEAHERASGRVRD